MKKFLYLTSAAALTLASCSDDLGFKNENGGQIIEGKSTITATFQMNDGLDTRTSLTSNGAGKGYSYLWELGDAIGVYSDVAAGYVDNAYYVYNQTTPSLSGTFAGQNELEENDYYVAYYPYNPNGAYNYDTQEVTVSISNQQTFNSTAYKNQPWTTDYATGCFANGAAPAVAFAQAGADNQLNLSFLPVASYLVLPVTGYNAGPVNNVTLTVTNSKGYYVRLAGDITVPMGPLMSGTALGNLNLDNVNGTGVPATNQMNVAELLGDANYSEFYINVNCSKAGQALDLSDPVNFWFVVPAGLELNGKTITLTINAGEDTQASVSRTFASDWNTADGTGKNVMGRNQVRWIWAGADYTPYLINSEEDTVVIQNQWQFLEYAYIISNWGINPQIAVNYSKVASDAYSSLPSICPDFNASKLGGKVNNAIIAKPITFSQEALWKYLGISTAQELEKLGQYYVDVYGTFLTEGYIPSIISQTENPVVISGGNDTDESFNSLTGLTINGNGIFNNVALQNININDFTVNAESVYEVGDKKQQVVYLVSQPTSGSYKNVTFNSGCRVNLPEGASEEDVNKVLFAALSTGWANGGTVNVTNETGYQFAELLNVNSDFDYTQNESMEVLDFNNIVMTGTTNGYIQTVTGQTDAGYLKSFLVNNIGTGYSIVDRDQEGTVQTSYWTGTTYGAAANTKFVSAELLAYVAQNNSEYPVELTNNIDLMGEYTNYKNEPANSYWWSTYEQEKTINVAVAEDDPWTISNVYINGTKDNEVSAGNFLTMFGYKSNVQNLTIDGITIENTGDNANPKAVIAAISQRPNWTGTPSSVKIYNMTVNADVAAGPVGGIYQFVNCAGNSELLNNTENLYLEFASTPELGEDMVWGTLAGELLVSVPSVDAGIQKMTITNNSLLESDLFGAVSVKINVKNANGTQIFLENFNLDLISAEDLTLVGGTVNNTGYPVLVISNGYMNSFAYYHSSDEDFGFKKMNTAPEPFVDLMTIKNPIIVK